MEVLFSVVEVSFLCDIQHFLFRVLSVVSCITVFYNEAGATKLLIINMHCNFDGVRLYLPNSKSRYATQVSVYVYIEFGFLCIVCNKLESRLCFSPIVHASHYVAWIERGVGCCEINYFTMLTCFELFL